MSKENLTIVLAAPRGFCAGVDRAIQIVEMALEKYGPPVYVRHEIVHNKFVVDSLKAKGAVFVEELDEIPADKEGDKRPVIFSAHGVPKSVPEAAKGRAMFYIDATCPLVSKVHKEAERYFAKGCQIILIGHAGHPEVVGTMGQLPKGAVLLVETLDDLEKLSCHPDRGVSEVEGSEPLSAGRENGEGLRSLDVARDDNFIVDETKLAYCTQTTLSVGDTAEIVEALKVRYPHIQGPHKEDICYATTNRQAAVKTIAPECDAVIVIGAPNSSNSNRLVEVAALHGCAKAMLVQRAGEIDWAWMEGVKTLGITAGASAPEILVDEVIAAAKERFEVTIREIAITQENVNFKVPKILTEEAA